MTKNHKTLGQGKQKQKQLMSVNFQISPMHLVWNLERRKHLIPIPKHNIFALTSYHTVQSTLHYASLEKY